jgi:O-antigen/teichoic acid export membrane protein
MSFDILGNALTQTALTYFASRTRSDVVGLVLLYGRVVYLLAVFVAAWTGGSFFAYLRAYLAADFCSAALALCLVLRRTPLRLRFNPRRWLFILKESFPLGILQVIGNIYIWTGSISLSIFAKPADVAFYGVCTGFVVSAFNISAYFMGSVLPSLVTADRSSLRKAIQHAWDIMSFVGVLVALETAGLRSELVTVIAGPKFSSASTPLGILGVVVMIMFLNSVISTSAVALGNYRMLLLIQLPALVLQIVLTTVLVPIYGVSGAAMAILGSELCSIAASLVFFSRRTGIRIRQKRELRLLLAGGLTIVPTLLIHYVWSGASAIADIIVYGVLVLVVYVVAAEVLRGVSDELLRVQENFIRVAKSMFRRYTFRG